MASDPAALENFELLVRSLLIRPDQPAVLILGHLSPQVVQTSGFGSSDHWHTLVAQFYDVPHIRFVHVLLTGALLTHSLLVSSRCSIPTT